MADQKDKIGRILVKKGLITETQLKEVLSEQQLTKKFLGAILLSKKLITEKQLLQALSEQYDMPFVKLEECNIDWNLAPSLLANILVEHNCFPISEDSDSVTIAVSNPLDVRGISGLRERLINKKVKIVLAETEDIAGAIKKQKEIIKRNIFKLLEKGNKKENKDG